MTQQIESWHLSKSVPISLIFGLLVQGAAIVWTVSMMMADISSNSSEISEVKERMRRVENAVHEQAVSMARIDENIKAIRKAVESMAQRPKP
jgi:Tfp pilus assembly protein PilO